MTADFTQTTQIIDICHNNHGCVKTFLNHKTFYDKLIVYKKFFTVQFLTKQ